MRTLQPIGGAEVDNAGKRRHYPRVIVRKDPVTELIAGVVRPERFQKSHHGHDNTPWTATVVASSLSYLHAGERVLIERYAGSDLLHDGERLTILPAHDVLAVLEEP
jgi:co-chaperonin GroES (HSP10)